MVMANHHSDNTQCFKQQWLRIGIQCRYSVLNRGYVNEKREASIIWKLEQETVQTERNSLSK